MNQEPFSLKKNATLKMCNLPDEKLKNVPDSADIVVYYPNKFINIKKWPVFIAMNPDAGNGGQAVLNYTKFADSVGFIVAAPNLAQDKDIDEARYFYTLSIIDFLNDQGFTRFQPVWIGGFSGGAKWALELGAFGGDIFSGVLAIGCNEDYATMGFNELKTNSALNVPIYLLNGTNDPIAGIGRTDYPEMINSLKKSGFKYVSIETFDGGHTIPFAETLKAFQYFKSQ